MHLKILSLEQSLGRGRGQSCLIRAVEFGLNPRSFSLGLDITYTSPYQPLQKEQSRKQRVHFSLYRVHLLPQVVVLHGVVELLGLV